MKLCKRHCLALLIISSCMQAGGGGRYWVRLPTADGDCGHVDRRHEARRRQRLGHGPHRAHAHQPAVRALFRGLPLLLLLSSLHVVPMPAAQALLAKFASMRFEGIGMSLSCAPGATFDCFSSARTCATPCTPPCIASEYAGVISCECACGDWRVLDADWGVGHDVHTFHYSPCTSSGSMRCTCFPTAYCSGLCALSYDALVCIRRDAHGSEHMQRVGYAANVFPHRQEL